MAWGGPSLGSPDIPFMDAIAATPITLRARLINLGSHRGGRRRPTPSASSRPFFAFSWRDCGVAAAQLRAAGARHHGGLPPLLLASRVQDGRVFQFVAGLAGVHRDAERSALVGERAPPPPRFSDCRAIRTRRSCGGFWHAHIGWVLDGDERPPRSGEHEGPHRFPELRFLDALEVAADDRDRVAFVCAVRWAPGSLGLRLRHRRSRSTRRCSSTRWGTSGVAALRHRRLVTEQRLLGVLVLGEGWHNNHHHARCRPATASRGGRLT